MGARQQAHLALDRAHAIEAASVEPFVVVHNQSAHRFLLDIIKGILENELGDLLRSKFFNQFRAYLISNSFDSAFAGRLARDEQGRHHAVACQRFGFLEDFLWDDIEGNFPFLFSMPSG